MQARLFTSHTFPLENGQQLDELTIAYHSYGQLNAAKDNVVWVCHALTGSSDVFGWWPGLFGEHGLFNPDEHFIVCANVLGSAYGTTSPLCINPSTGKPYYLDFPAFSIRDIVAANQRLAEHLQIGSIDLLIGGSLGGQQVLEWAAAASIHINKLVVIGAAAQSSPWSIAFNESQRLAILADPTFQAAQDQHGGKAGLKAARSIAMLSYRNYETYRHTQSEIDADITDGYRASSYQRYQGEKFAGRFNAYSYWYLTKAMDSHNIGRNNRSVAQALSRITARTLVVGIPSDILFPPSEQRFIADHIPNACYYALESSYGHDGFLIETATLTGVIRSFLAEAVAQLDKEIEFKAY